MTDPATDAVATGMIARELPADPDDCDSRVVHAPRAAGVPTDPQIGSLTDRSRSPAQRPGGDSL